MMVVITSRRPCYSAFDFSRQILDHIDATLHGNSPVAFGLHPNAEIGFRTVRDSLELAMARNQGVG